MSEAPSPSSDPLRAHYTRRDVARLFGLSVSRLSHWQRQGFIVPSAQVGRRYMYTFHDLIALRSVCELLERGLPIRHIRSAIASLRTSLPEALSPLQNLRICSEDGKHIVVEHDGQRFDPMSGQLLFDFSARTLRRDVLRVLHPEQPASEMRRKAYRYFLEGCRLDEDEAMYEHAIEAYERALRCDSAFTSAIVNLANLRWRNKHIEQARALYERVLSIDAHHPEALYNLGVLECEARCYKDAAKAFRQALEAAPAFAAAHFNLASVLDRLQHKDEAQQHWQRYLDLEPSGDWADKARQHVAT